MKKRWMMFGILGVLAVGSFTVYASEQAVSESETVRNITSQEVEATTEMETEAEPVICTEATAVDFVEWQEKNPLTVRLPRKCRFAGSFWETILP